MAEEDKPEGAVCALVARMRRVHVRLLARTVAW